ncbi:MAG: hypothetical protein LAP87_09710 [Acidobacteriia bacterium]|nr:hypothetical protein [Terriglobia bacterium]
MYRGLLRILFAVCCTALLPAAAPAQPAGGDQLVRTKGGEFTFRVPAAWKILAGANEVEAAGDRIWMKLHYGKLFMSIRSSIGDLTESIEQDWKNVTSEDDKADMGGNQALIRVFHGVNQDGVRTVRRAALFNPMPDPGNHGCIFLFDVAERDYARSLPLIQRIEQSFRVGGNNPTPPPPGPARQPAVETRPAPAPGGTGAASRIEPYVAPNRLFALYKPTDWTVTQAASEGVLGVTVTSPDRRSQVNLLWMRASRPNLVRFMVTCRSALAQTYPGAAYSQIFVSRDGTRGTATVTYTLGNLRAQGRVYFEAGENGATMQEYAAPETLLAVERPLLLNVLASVAFIRAPRGGAAGQAAPVQIPLVERQAPDGSLSLKMPADWNFLAAQGRVIAGQPGGGMGFIFTSFSGNPMLAQATIAQGVIASPYRRPAQTLPVILLGFGHRNPVITSAAADRATMGECGAYLRGGCEAEDLMAQWTSKGGADCVGAFKVVNTRPGVMGQWSSIVAGIWGPRQEFARYYPMLEQVGNSFAIRAGYARAYIAAGLENLRVLQQQTARSIASLNYAREDMQRAWEDRQARKDYVESKWDDYRRGNSYWVSDLEGGRVYHTDTWGTRDTLTGDYYEGGGYTWTNFEGQNPHYPSENMREVSSYELEHGAPPR